MRAGARRWELRGINMRKNRPANSKIIKITITAIVVILFILGLTAYLFVHNYINKLNLVSTTDQNETVAEQDNEPKSEDLITEDEDNTGDDAPEDEIKTLEDKIRSNMEENKTELMNDKDVFNILLIGSDNRIATDTGRSDAMILVSINKKTKTLVATSILRDIYLAIPGHGNNRINAAYANGGADLLMDTLKQNFKIQIDRYASVDFYSFMDIIDAIDGITLDVTEEEIPIINNYIMGLNKLTGKEAKVDLLTKPGTLLLNGKQALSYARNRYIGTDFERTARQRRVLEKVFEKVKKSNLIEINKLLNIILPQVTTNLTEGEVFSLILNLAAYKDYAIEQWSIPVKDSYSFLRIRGMDVIGMDFDENRKELNKRIYSE